ncbi:hypothetical protein Zmor_016194 [Zophobas morio]|uniref:Major facilitator superfamily (MFS) profile domain-containing protein n=1 Tax=Zophobas morio TaxID=2755281 RepID=A0AA38MIC2_9CUCU|nr:hypothetical protein Zmor_016194 [Zophobas morio]
MLNTNTTFNYLPLYMRQVLHYEIRENGLLSSLPFLGPYSMALVTSYLADRWTKSATFTTPTIRKIFTGLFFLGSVVLLSVLCFWGYVRIVSVSVFILWQTIFGSAAAGFISNTMDISPVYSGTILGSAATVGGFTGYLSSLLVTAFVRGEGDVFEQWRGVFGVLIGTNLFGWGFYFWGMSGEVQEWNGESGMEMEAVNRVEVD